MKCISNRSALWCLTVISLFGAACGGSDEGAAPTATTEVAGAPAPSSSPPDSSVPDTSAPVSSAPTSSEPDPEPSTSLAAAPAEPAWFFDSVPVQGLARATCAGGGPDVNVVTGRAVILERVPGEADTVAGLLGTTADPVGPADFLGGVYTIDVDPSIDDGSSSSPFALQLRALQRAGVAIDREYIAAPLPNYQPKPDSAPVLDVGAPAPPDGVDPGDGDGVRVVVVDVGTTAADTAVLDASSDYVAAADLARFQAFDASSIYREHGGFAASLVDRYLPAARVELWPLPAAPLLEADPNPGVAESDLLAVLAAAVGRRTVGTSWTLTDVPEMVNLSLGGYGCVDLAHLTLAALLDEITAGGSSLVAAAAGNDGTADLVFPAAFASDEVVAEIATVVAQAPVDPDIASAAAGANLTTSAVSPLLERVTSYVTSVGSATDPGDPEFGGASPDCFSNSGWVDIFTPGADQVAGYSASSTGWASWSGTSFATPRFVAAIVRSAGASSQSAAEFWSSGAGRTVGNYAAVDRGVIVEPSTLVPPVCS
jgi:hypothetical protein